MKCVDCGKEVDEVCGDGFCRDCHVSLSFEDCIDGTWLAKRYLEIAERIPQVDIKEHKKWLKSLYPNAKI